MIGRRLVTLRQQLTVTMAMPFRRAKPVNVPTSVKTYLFTARTKGKQTPGSIYAADMAAARATLEAEGYEGVEFLDEGSDEASQKASFATLPAQEIDPAQMARARKVSGVGATLLFSLRGNAPILVPLLAWNAWSLVQGAPFDWGDWLGFGLTVLVLGEVLRLMIPGILFQKLLRAQVYARWREAERIVRWMRRYPFGAALSPFMHDFYDAKVLIGLGNTDEAFELYAKWRGHPDVPPASFLALHSSLLDQARRFPEKIAGLHQVAALEPDSAQAWIELALTYARANLGIAAARAAAAEAAQREMSVLFKAGLEHACGIIALDSGMPDAALVHFASAAERYSAGGGSPLLVLAHAGVQAFVAIALVRLGRRADAEQIWQGAGVLMQAHGEREVLDRYEAALANRPYFVVP